jgi:lipopolysaccharide exporter
MGGLGRPGVAAVKWSAVSTVARLVLQLLAQVVLARTLGPDIFGVFAIGMVVLTFATFVSGFGFSWSLLQKTTLIDDDVRFAWTWQLAVGALTMVALYFLATPLAQYFNEPRALGVIQWLSLACLLTAAAAPATYLLQRDLNFRAVGLIQVGSYAAGYMAVGVPMALAGRGENALVAAWLVQAAVQLAASYWLKPHPVRPLLWYAGASGAIGTGRMVLLTNIANWVLNNMDRILIGRLLNAHALGLYNVAYNLATMPNTLLLGALQPAFLAAGAHMQNELQRFARAYVQMLATVLVLGLPAFVFLAAISADLVRLLYGPQWSGAAWVLGILFLSMPAYVIWGLSTPVLWNTGRKHLEFTLQLPLVFVGAAGFYAYAGQGIRTAATVAALLLLLRAMVVAGAACRALHIGFSKLWPHCARGLLLSALAAAGALSGQKLMAGFEQPLLSLAASGALSFGMLAALLAVRPQFLGQDAAGMVLRFVPGLASVLQRTGASPLPDKLGEQRL